MKMHDGQADIDAGLVRRLPRMARSARDLEHEARWLPRLAGRLPLRIPEPVALGRPGDPFGWAIYRWIEGQPHADELVDERQAARDLARFVRNCAGSIPRTAARRAQAAARTRRRDPRWDRGGRRRHRPGRGPGRLGTRAGGTCLGWGGTGLDPRWPAPAQPPGGRLRAVIDFGAAGAGDPAADLIAAQSVFGPAGRQVLRHALGAADGA
jgi:aminoglycoside phosphotransferase (APT) family kinase protein